MSDLTPDGDLFSDAGVAIRSFISFNPKGLSEDERVILQSWAQDCTDPASMIRLSRLIEGLSFGR
ncbi:MAG: hypothetical protein AAF231_02950 [Pseudomonadota bacterium]